MIKTPTAKSRDMTRNHFSLKGLLAIAAASTAAAQKLAGHVDYVVVGSGPAGFVLAEQLSRNPKVNVTLLEVGPDGSDDPVINSKAQIPKRCQGFC